MRALPERVSGDGRRQCSAFSWGSDYLPESGPEVAGGLLRIHHSGM